NTPRRYRRRKTGPGHSTRRRIHCGDLLQTPGYPRGRLARITQKDGHHTDSARGDSSRYFYDKLSRLTRAYNADSDLRLGYNTVGLRPLQSPQKSAKYPLTSNPGKLGDFVHEQLVTRQWPLPHRKAS
ncbi:hypothetical protein, partial [Neisseria dumasiana]